MSPRRPRPKGRPRRTVVIGGNPSDPRGFYVAATEFLAWLEHHGYAPSTVLDRSWHLANFIAWAELRGVDRPQDVTLSVLEAYQRHVALRRKSDGTPLSWSTQRQALAPLAVFFSWCTRTHRVLYNPASELVMPRKTFPLPKATLTHDDAEAVLAVPDTGTPLGFRDRVILEVLYATAMRRGELVGLDLPDVDLARRFATLRVTKTRRDRAVPLGERASAWLARYLADVRPELVVGADPGAVFLAGNGERLGPKWLSSQVHHYVEAAQVGKAGSCHLFRHSAATLMIEGGADTRYVQELLGHTDLNSTQIYTRVAPERLAAIHAATHPGARLPSAGGWPGG
ncbi:MAG TPA: site-specific tyrosine recombinase XerC [Acidimicrobiales bacterium]|nr:site-specific tyrosine recombinase XerC [Acidimicrobiales bacterium]